MVHLYRGTCASAALAISLLSSGNVLTRGAFAHPPAIVNQGTEKAMGEEVADFRRRMAKAITSKDVKTLRAMYGDSFRHTHASGQLDGKDARIAAALSGHPMIETAAVEDLKITVPNGWAAVATGSSRLRAADGTSHAYRWTAVYVRVGEDWQLAASQETRVP